MKKKFEKICENNVRILEIITNEKYDRLNDEREIIQKDLKKLTSSTKSILKKEIN